LDRAVALREGLTPGPALRVVAKNLRIDEADSPIAGPFSLDLSADLRVDADLQAKIVMEGRVTDVWREFSGPTTTGPTRIEQRLPGGSGFAMVLSIGSTSMFREALAQYRKLRPSTGSETDALFDTLMPGIEALSEVVGPSAGMTLHPARGGMALVVALEVKDGGAASKSLGTIVDAIVAANSATRVERVKVAGVQVHAITSPPSAGSDASASTHPMRVWVFVHRDVAVLVMAPDPRPMAEAIIRPRGPRLADDGGLVRLRALLGGCQTCMTFDPIRTAEASLLAQARNGNKAAAGRAKVLAKRKSHGAVSIGSKFHDDGRGMTVALDVPRSLLFGPTDVAQLVMAGFSGERERERAGGAILRAVTGFGDRTCACKDMDCVMAVQREMTAWAAANRDAQGTEEQATEIAAEGKRMADCVGRIAAASGG
jgi:hypothetical protein